MVSFTLKLITSAIRKSIKYNLFYASTCLMQYCVKCTFQLFPLFEGRRYKNYLVFYLLYILYRTRYLYIFQARFIQVLSWLMQRLYKVLRRKITSLLQKITVSLKEVFQQVTFSRIFAHDQRRTAKTCILGGFLIDELCILYFMWGMIRYFGHALDNNHIRQIITNLRNVKIFNFAVSYCDFGTLFSLFSTQSRQLREYCSTSRSRAKIRTF